MNVGELKKTLEKYPNDMEIINSRHSDYEIVLEEDWEVVQGVENGWNGLSFWVMRSHPTMSEENKRREKSYLCLSGS